MSNDRPSDEEKEGIQLPDPPDWDWKRPEHQAERDPGARGLMEAKVQRGIGVALAIGYSFVGPVAAGLAFGYLMDGRLGGTYTVVGLLVGTVAAFMLLVRLVNRLNEDAKN